MWFLQALSSVACWGGADICYKAASDKRENYTSLKIIIAVGVVMGLHAAYQLFFAGVPYDLSYIVGYLPVSACYISSMAIGYFGLRYMELSVASPVQSASGAITAVLCVVFLGAALSLPEGISVALMCGGVIALGIMDRRRADTANIGGKYLKSLPAFILPVLYALIDGLGTFADAVVLDGAAFTEDQANISYEITFFVCAAVAAVYVYGVRREKLMPKRMPARYAAAGLETVGQFFYVYALAQNPAVAAPMIACYPVLSMILSRVLLKEKLTRGQYIAAAAVLCGILILGIMEGLAGE